MRCSARRRARCALPTWALLALGLAASAAGTACDIFVLGTPCASHADCAQGEACDYSSGYCVSGDAVTRDAARADRAGSDGGARDAHATERELPDAGAPDGTAADALAADGSGREAGGLDSARHEAGAGDAARRDTAASDTAPSDAAPSDAAPLDTARIDAAPADATAQDLAVPDLSIPDRWAPDQWAPDQWAPDLAAVDASRCGACPEGQPHCDADAGICVACIDDEHCDLCEACQGGVCAIAQGAPCDAGFNCENYVKGSLHDYYNSREVCYAYASAEIPGTCDLAGRCNEPSVSACTAVTFGATLWSCDDECALDSPDPLACPSRAAISEAALEKHCYLGVPTSGCGSVECYRISPHNDYVSRQRCGDYGTCFTHSQDDNCGNFACDGTQDPPSCKQTCDGAEDCVAAGFCKLPEGICCDCRDQVPDDRCPCDAGT